MTPELATRAAALIRASAEQGLQIGTVESCTGGLVAGLLTDVPGSSAVLERGAVTYSNEAKTDIVGVSAAMICEHGAVSEPVARAMAEGALSRWPVDIAVSITGIAGPGGATPNKPVGLVHFALAQRDRDTVHSERRFGDLGRSEVRRLAVEQALAMLEAAVQAEARP